MSRSLTGKVALITGAGSGIGAAVATRLARDGATVVVTDIDLDSARRVCGQVSAGGAPAMAIRLDVSVEDDWRAAVDHVGERFGTIDVLHSNAGLTSPGVFAQDLDVVRMDTELWDRVLAVNLRGVMLSCKHVIPTMLRAGSGAIIVTSSVKGQVGSTYRTAYAASKGGIDALVRVVATGYGKLGIRCNAIAPGIVETEAFAGLTDDQRTAFTAAHLTPQLGRPDDIAGVVAFLAGDDARFVTGQIIRVDGGLSVHVPVLSPPLTIP